MRGKHVRSTNAAPSRAALPVGEAADQCADSEDIGQGGDSVFRKQHDCWSQVPQHESSLHKHEQRVPQKEDLHRRKQVPPPLTQEHQSGCSPEEDKELQEQRQQQEDRDKDRQQLEQARMLSAAELKHSFSGLRRLSTLTRLPSNEFHTWETFLLPTAAAALSVPMLTLVGSAPFLCMVLFISCLHNVIAAMLMMHWVCMIAVPLLYVKYIEKSFEYYMHVWAVQSCRFAAQWKRALLLGCGAAAAVYLVFSLLRSCGGAWFGQMIDNARSRALTGGLDLPLGPLLVVGCYFFTCNPIIEEWFWRVFLYREFGGAVFFSAGYRRGLFLLRETPSHRGQRESTTASDSTAQLSPPFAGHRGLIGGVNALRNALRSTGILGGADAYNYYELHCERETATPAAAVVSAATDTNEGSSRTYPPASRQPTPAAVARHSSSGESSRGTTKESASPGDSTRPCDPAASSGSAGQAVVPAAAQDAETSRGSFKEEEVVPDASGWSAFRLPPRSPSFSIQPTARADPLLVNAPSDSKAAEACDASFAPSSPPGSPFALRGSMAGRLSTPSGEGLPLDGSFSRPTSPFSAASRSSGAVEGAFESLPALSAESEARQRSTTTGEENMNSGTSTPAPDAPIITHVGGGLLQVDLRLSLLGQVVLSMFYASYHTVVLSFLTGALGGCIAVPCVAVLGMSLILLRNSCLFGLLGGVVVHAGVDLGVVLVIGAILQYYP